LVQYLKCRRWVAGDENSITGTRVHHRHREPLPAPARAGRLGVTLNWRNWRRLERGLWFALDYDLHAKKLKQFSGGNNANCPSGHETGYLGLGDAATSCDFCVF
jgi:hypothetical protein